MPCRRRSWVSAPRPTVESWLTLNLPGNHHWPATEAEALAGVLDRLRATFRWKVNGLDSAGHTAMILSSTLTLWAVSFRKHLVLVEDYYALLRR